MKNLKALRKERGLSQTDFAQALGSAQTTVSQWERGTREPDIGTITKIAEFFEVSTDYLLGKTETKKAPSSEGADGDVGVLLDRTLDMLKDEGSVQFNGRMLDSDAKQLLLDSLQSNIRLTDELSKRAKGNDEKG